MLPNDKIHVDAGIDSKVSDLLDNAGWAVNINDSFVNSHFESIPSLGSLTTGTLSCSNSEYLGWDAQRTLGLIALVLGSGNNLRAGALEGLHILASESHSTRGSQHKWEGT